MDIVFYVMTAQIILGGFDNLYHHELTEKLPSKPSARHELTFHFIRELIYGVIFFGLAWYEWHGTWAIILGLLIITELVVTLIDFVIEDKTRLLPPFERVLHTLLAINIGIFLSVFAPILYSWYGQGTAMVAADYGLWSWFFTFCAAGVFAWGIRNLIAVMNLHILKVPQWQRKPYKKGSNKNPKTYLITGATGFIGTALVRRLVGQGHNIIALSRNKEKVAYKFGSHVTTIDDLAAINSNRKIDVIINLAGESLVGGLWTKKRKAKFVDSRVNATKAIAELIQRLSNKPELLINASAIGIYGNRHNQTLNEESSEGNDFMARICQATEEETKKIKHPGLRVIRLRIGLVLDGKGGVLVPMLLSTKLFAGMIMGSGKQYMSWIDLKDIIRLIEFIENKPKLTGAINATAPHPATHKAFMKTLGKALKRPVLFKAPAFIFRILLRDMAALFINGQRIIPQKALNAGFEFEYPELHQCFERITTKPEPTETGIAKVYYNSECPVCDKEMNHYCELSSSEKAPMDFKAIAQHPDGLKQYGLTKQDIERRMYVLKANGEIANGVGATIEIWKHLDRYKTLSKVLAYPLVNFIASFVYEGMVVPYMASFNAKRRRKITN